MSDLETQLAYPLKDEVWKRASRNFKKRAFQDGWADISYEDHETPVGLVRLSATKEGVVCLTFEVENQEKVMESLAVKVSPRMLKVSTPLLTEARQELDQYFQGKRHSFDVPLDFRLMKAFRKEVLMATAKIPYGQTLSYAKVAEEAGNPKAVRATGSALATNPIPIFVPCHRVVRSDGTFGQYRGGVAAKTLLLELEQQAR